MKYKRITVEYFQDNGIDIRSLAMVNLTELSRKIGIDRALLSKARANKYTLSEEQYLKIKKELEP